MRNRSMMPMLPAASFKTYQLVSPLATHWRPATCEEIGCENFIKGWQTILDEATERGQYHAHTIRKLARRSFTEERETTGLTIFTFPPGQECFKAHQTKVNRPPRFLVRGGDFRGNPRGTPLIEHTSAANWVDDFANHQERLKTRLEQG